MSLNITNSIPITLNDLLVKLKILSMVERGKKINITSMTFVDCTSWLGSLNRSLNGEGRKSLMVHLNQIIQQAIAAINEYQNTEYLHLIINSLAEAKVGIQNLASTYQKDPNIVAQINVCTSNINIQLNNHRHLLNGQKNLQQQSPPLPIINTYPVFGPNSLKSHSLPQSQSTNYLPGGSY